MRNERLYFVVSAIIGGIWSLWRYGRQWKAPAIMGQIQPNTKASLRVLVIRLDEMGDMVTTLAMIKAIRAHHPAITLDLWCKAVQADWLAPQSLVHTLWTEQGPSLKEHYDWILECRGNWQTLRFALRTLPMGRRDRGSIRIRQRLWGRPQPHEWDINMMIAAPLLPAPAKDSSWHEFWNSWHYGNYLPLLHAQDPVALAEINLFKQRLDLHQYVVFHAGARKLLRRWSLQSWADLAQRLHRDYGMEIVFVGTPDEVGDVHRIRQMLGFETFTYMEGRSIRYLIPLLAQASLMIGNESGPMHLASATGCPTIGLFGPGEPEIFSPKAENFQALHVKLPCNPCGQIRCVVPDNPCMNRIAVDDVMSAVRDLLS